MKAPPLTILFVSSIALFSFIGVFEQSSTLYRFTNTIIAGSSSSSSKFAISPNKNKNHTRSRRDRRRKQQRLSHHPPVPSYYHPTEHYKLPDGRILYFQHLHKSGGTTLCRLAVANRMMADAAHNCNVQPDQRCCGRRDDPDALAVFASTTAYTFVANERDMYATMDTTRFRYVTVLRKSRERYVSHYKHVYRVHYYYHYRDGKQQQQHDGDDVMSFNDWWKAQPDNFITRQLCGPRCRDVNKYQIDATLFDYTLQRLKMFEDILFLEDFDNSMRRFSERVGWNATNITLPSAEAAAAKSTNADPNDKAFYASVIVDDDTSSWDPLMSALDDALYAYTQKRQDGAIAGASKLPGTLAEQLAAYFLRGPQHNCSNPCCGSTCSKYR